MHGMNNKDDILEAMSTGATSSEWAAIERQEKKEEWEKLKISRDSGEISPEEFKKRKSQLFENR